MNPRKDRDGVDDWSASPTSSTRRFKRRRMAVGLGATRILRLWRWSRTQFAQAVLYLGHWLPQSHSFLHFTVGSRCVRGPVRATNEDRCYADQHTGLFIVADGMGGHAGGEQASQTVIEVIASRLGWSLRRGKLVTPALRDFMRESVLAANRELIDLAKADVSLVGMGSTALIGVIHRNQLLVCSVGDSRAYLYREGELRQLTLDDTLVQGLVSAGALTTSEAVRHPLRHVLVHSVCTRRLEKTLRVDSCKLRPGDRLIFASDGLTDRIGPEELSAILEQHVDARQAATALIDAAQEAGSRDNITCIVVDMEP